MYDSPVVRLALKVAATAHRRQPRKGTDIPYIVHPVAVMLVLTEGTNDEATLAAALLHDVLEDCGDLYGESQMRRDFGDVITDTVKAVTKDSTIKNWYERNQQYLVTLRESGNERAWMVSAADKINNLTDVLEDHARVGDQLWGRFNASKRDQLWWYGSISRLMADVLPGHALTQRLELLVAELEAILNATDDDEVYASI